MKNSIIGICGTGGFAREVMPLVQSALLLGSQAGESSNAEVCFIEKNPTSDHVNGIKVLSEADFFKAKKLEKYFNVAIADGNIRKSIVEKFVDQGVLPFEVIASNSSVGSTSKIGEGAILTHGSIVTSNAVVGKFFHANLYSYVAHDCVIGDYVTFSPGVQCNGNVKIGNNVFIGAGAIIRPGNSNEPLTIGDGSFIGMGSIVTQNVEPYSRVLPSRSVDQ
jgi:sugar O-acyltransferase (sialic acid O-acetyltransferase NeuD family)